MPRSVSRIRDSLKRALDRRYATHNVLRDTHAVLDALAKRVDGLEAGLTRVRHKQEGTVARLDELDSRFQSIYRQIGGVTQGHGHETSIPSELNRQLAECIRLTNECARAIEHILQQEVLIRRDLDSVLSSGEPVESGG